MNTKTVLIAIAALSVTTFVVLQARPDKGVQVRVTSPLRGVMTSVISATGKVVSRQEAEVASPVASRVTRVLVAEGQKVSRGTLLVTLDDREAGNRISGDRAMASEARARVEQADRALQATRKVYGVGGASLSEVQNAELQLKAAQAAEKKIATEVRSSALFQERFRIVAPFNGIILRKSVQVGDVVSCGSPLLSLADVSQGEIEVSVDEADAGSLRPGQEVEVSCEALGNRVWKENIVRIDRAVHKDGSANTLKAHVSLGHNLAELRLGQQVDVKIKIAEKTGVLKVPFDAVITRDGKKHLATVRSGAVHFEPVVTGLEDASSVEIISPASLNGEIILTEGKTLREGEQVRIAARAGK